MIPIQELIRIMIRQKALKEVIRHLVQVIYVALLTVCSQ